MKRSLTKTAVLIAALSMSGLALADGQALYNSSGCGTCHGPTGMGDGPAAAAMNPKPRNFASGEFAYDTDGDGTKGSDADLLNVVKNGSAKYGGSPTMPGHAHIAEADLKAIIAYIRSLSKN